MSEFNGEVVVAQTISLRFPESGKLAWIKCAPGNIVKKGAPLAGLDPKPTQIFLDIELADYRRIRAEFDRLSRDIPEANTPDEKTTKEIAQSRLDVSIKTVEKYKLQLDSLTLTAPVDAVVISTKGLVESVNVTPSGFPVELIPLDSCAFEITIEEKDLSKFSPSQKAKITLKNGTKFDTKVTYISPQAEKEKFIIHFSLPTMDLTNFRIGFSGKVAL